MHYVAELVGKKLTVLRKETESGKLIGDAMIACTKCWLDTGVRGVPIETSTRTEAKKKKEFEYWCSGCGENLGTWSEDDEKEIKEAAGEH